MEAAPLPPTFHRDDVPGLVVVDALSEVPGTPRGIESGDRKVMLDGRKAGEVSSVGGRHRRRCTAVRVGEGKGTGTEDR